ncbi:MAG: uncharacterized protein QOI76_3508 [Frankiales bacterium]|jgi:nitroimidazol reductase NimA-like FMN-containing flavoprotein (pyridoxamine 5'-phosphate oxidase superfamily)|nr:uncharacterized protein [Frankiales bacterium]
MDVLESLSRPECLALLRTARLGRVAYSERALPAIATVPFAVVEESIVVRVDGGTLLAAALRGAVVAFQVDHGSSWSVTCIGLVRQLLDPDEVAAVGSLTCWPEPAPAVSEFLLIESEGLQGRHFLGSAA